MKNFIIYETKTNKVRFIESRPDGVPIVHDDLAFVLVEGDLLSIDQYWIVNSALKIRSPQPSMFYFWDVDKWVLDEILYNASETEIQTGSRNNLLVESDWTDSLSAKQRLGDDLYKQWQDYRQALRDITSQGGFPLSIVWPEKPM